MLRSPYRSLPAAGSCHYYEKHNKKLSSALIRSGLDLIRPEMIEVLNLIIGVDHGLWHMHGSERGRTMTDEVVFRNS